jgi:uncharacterized protein with beta-barrel porin domain
MIPRAWRALPAIVLLLWPLADARAQQPCTTIGTNQTCTNAVAISGGGVGINDTATLTLTNTATGTVTGTIDGVNASTANVTNSGIIQGTGSSGTGISAANANVTNFGTISGFVFGIAPSNTANVTNTGTIQATGLNGFGIAAIGIANITNSGTIQALGTNGVGAADAGGNTTFNVTNSGNIKAVGAGVSTTATVSTTFNLMNTGTIQVSGAIGVGVSNAANVSSTFNVTNFGTIQATGADGVGISDNSNTTAAKLTNFGSISGGAAGIEITSPNFTGSITNAGTVSSIVGPGIVVTASTFTASIANTGTISGVTGISTASAPSVGIFDSGIIVGTGGIAILFGTGTNTLTLGPGFNIQGNVIGSGADIFQLGGAGSGNFNLSTIGAAQQYQGFTTFNVVSGVWNTTGTFGQAHAWNVNGGTLAGTGTFQSVNVNAGGTLEPGTPGTPATLMTINGNLAFASGAAYLVNLNSSTASRANVAGAVTLNGVVQGFLTAGSYNGRTSYDVLDPTSISGKFTGFTAINAPGFGGTLTYTPTNVLLNLTANLGTGGNINQNQQNVANAINNVFNSGGTLPANFFPLFTLSGGALGTALSQLDGEAGTGAERAAFQLTDQFLELMLDPFVNGRGYAPGAPGGGALGFAPDQQESLPPDVALAYASIFKAPPKPTFDQRWSVWGSAFGGSNTTNGDPVAGSNTTRTGTFGVAAGADYRISPYTTVGFALAGAGTNWGLANALGTGRSDALQAGAYGISWFGPAYLAGALSFSNHWFTTNRSALGDQITANFVGQGYGARAEGGYRVAVLPTFGVTPYGAVQFQDFNTPAFSETDQTGGGLGLNVAAMNATDVRTELGSRFDAPTLLYGRPLVLYGRVAWAHDFVSNPALGAVFQTLPGGSFTVNGAPIPHDSALTTAGAQLFLSASWSLLAKFDGEFANGSQTYAGSGTLRYTW